MPYPPPPPPPEVGEFQGIGLLPAPEIPSVVGHSGDFLGTDGVIPEWEPVTGVLPDQSGHAGQFLTTDGSVASWATTSAVLPPQTGHGGEFLTTDGSSASWGEVPVTPFDVSLFGAVPNDPTNDFALAYYAALAAQRNATTIIGASLRQAPVGIYIPPGTYYSSVPICTAGDRYGEVDVGGAGQTLTVIAPGPGTASTPSQVQSWSGPVMYACTAWNSTTISNPLLNTSLPTYAAPLVGATGQSLVLAKANFGINNCMRLSDSWPWGNWLSGTTRIESFGLQFWVKTNSAGAAGERGIIGSRGPPWNFNRIPAPLADISFGVYAVSDGTNVKLRAYMTLNPDWNTLISMQATGTLYTIDSSNITIGASVNVELNYDGGHIDFFVNGVSQGHVAATGPIIHAGWESISIGAQGYESLSASIADINTIDSGAIDSVRLSNIPRHTGTGSFTPPVAKYTWDANTYALYNWDQPLKTVPFGVIDTLTLPFVVGQVATGHDTNGTIAGPAPHYIRLDGAGGDNADTYIHDLCVAGYRSCSGIILNAAPRSFVTDVWITNCSQYGILVTNAISFYARLTSITVFDIISIGVQLFGDLNRFNGQSCAVGVFLTGGGRVFYGNYQPTFSSYAGIVLDGAQFPAEIGWFSLDDEVYAFERQIGGLVVGPGSGTAKFNDNFWGTSGGVSPPAQYFGLQVDAQVIHLNDVFSADRDNPDLTFSAIKWSGAGLPPVNIVLESCKVRDIRIPALPLSNVEGWISVRNANNTSNQKGLSISDLQANNLAGTFAVSGAYTFGQVQFLQSEPDGNYDIIVTCKSAQGGSPAAGSNRVLSYVTAPDGFTVNLEAAPGGSVELTFSWMLIRTNPPAELTIFSPAIPSTAVNPLDLASQNTPFGVGFTVIPVGRNVLPINGAVVAKQTIVADGSPVALNSWELSLTIGNGLVEASLGTTVVDLDAYVFRGRFFSIHNPGSNNFMLAYYGAGQFPARYGNSAGPQVIGLSSVVGLQQTPIHIGERSGGSQPLTVATLKNFKMDQVSTRCISSDSAIGPGGLPESAFIGDNTVIGFGSNTVLGGFATQIAESRYSTTYYWIGCRWIGTGLTGPSGQYLEIFRPWLGQSTAPALTNFCLYPGVVDITNNVSATTVMATLTNILEGEKAQSTFIPPTSFTTPQDLRAFSISRVPASGSANYTINGRPFVVTFSVDSQTTVNNLIAQIAADGPSAAIFQGVAQPPSNSPFWVLQLVVKAPGTSGNGYVCTSDGGGGSFWYGFVGGIPQTGPSVQTFNGGDTTCVINGTQFIATFDTDANTTVNNLIARIVADVPTNALVTVTNVASQMLCVANAAGFAGNSITLGGNGANSPSNQTWIGLGGNTHMAGGSNGVITSGVPNILFCNCPPIGSIPGVTGAMITQLNALNVLINAYVGAGVTVVDVNSRLWNPANHDNILPAYSQSGQCNDAGHVALFNLLAPNLPGVGTAPSAFTYTTNPASYASGGPIAANNPIITGTVVRYTVSPPLPTGLVISSTTGVISGTPTTPTAAANYLVGASNSAGTVTVAVNITIT